MVPGVVQLETQVVGRPQNDDDGVGGQVARLRHPEGRPNAVVPVDTEYVAPARQHVGPVPIAVRQSMNVLIVLAQVIRARDRRAGEQSYLALAAMIKTHDATIIDMIWANVGESDRGFLLVLMARLQGGSANGERNGAAEAFRIEAIGGDQRLDVLRDDVELGGDVGARQMLVFRRVAVVGRPDGLQGRVLRRDFRRRALFPIELLERTGRDLLSY
jgi:hypothetical protein